LSTSAAESKSGRSCPSAEDDLKALRTRMCLQLAGAYLAPSFRWRQTAQNGPCSVSDSYSIRHKKRSRKKYKTLKNVKTWENTKRVE